MLPSGLRPGVFARLRPRFVDIELASKTLRDFDLVLVGADGELKPANSVHDDILARHPLNRDLYRTLYLIYLAIADDLPTAMDEEYKARADAVAPELDNLSSVLLTMVEEPSQLVVDAIWNFTSFSSWRYPNVTLAYALLPHLDGDPQWKAECLQSIGKCQHTLGKFTEAISTLETAAPLYLHVDDPASAAWCRRMVGTAHAFSGDKEQAVKCLNDARAMYANLGDEHGEARCRNDLGEVMRQKQDYAASLEHLVAARDIFNSLGDSFAAAQSSEGIGCAYRDQGDFESAVVEFEAAYAVFLSLGDEFHQAQSGRYIGSIQCLQGDLSSAEAYLVPAEEYYRKHDSQDLVLCVYDIGCLRRNQGRHKEAIEHFKLALDLAEDLGKDQYVAACKAELMALSSAVED